MPVLDAHCHILPPSFKGRRSELTDLDATFGPLFSCPDSRMATADELVDAMGRDGVDHAIVMGFGWSSYQVASEVNDYIIQAVLDYPGRLTGFCSVNPGWGDEALREVERCAAAGLRGIGELHPDTQRTDIASEEAMSPIMDLARGLELPVLVHSSEPVGHQYPGKGQTTPGKLYRFVVNFPGNTVICAHWGGGLPFYALMPEVAAGLSNVYFDTAASPFLYRPEIYSVVSGLVGPERILFASDFPLMEQSRPLEQVTALGLPPPEQDLILGANAARLLGLAWPAERHGTGADNE